MAKIGTFAENRKNFLLRPAKELILPLKYSSWNALTGKYHPRPEKNLYVEKNDLKVTKNRIFGYGILTTFRKLHFSTANIKNNYNKVTLTKITLNAACNDVLILFLRRL